MRMEISADTLLCFPLPVGGVCYMICPCLCSVCSLQHWWPFCVSAVAERRAGQTMHCRVLFTLVTIYFDEDRLQKKVLINRKKVFLAPLSSTF